MVSALNTIITFRASMRSGWLISPPRDVLTIKAVVFIFSNASLLKIPLVSSLKDEVIIMISESVKSLSKVTNFAPMDFPSSFSVRDE